MKGKILWSLAGLLMVLLLLLGGLLTSPVGLSVLIKSVERVSQDTITVRSVAGSLIGGLQVNGFAYTADGQKVTLDRLSLSLKPMQVVLGKLAIASLDASGLAIEVKPGEESASLPEISLPFPVMVDKVRVENIKIVSDPAVAATKIRSVNLKAAEMVESRLKVGQLEVITEAFRVKAAGKLETSGAYPLDLTLNYLVKIEDYASIAGSGTIGGTMYSLLIDTQASAPYDATVTGQIDNLLDQPLWSLRLKSSKTALDAINSSWPQLALSELDIEGSGTMESYSLDGHSQGVYATDKAGMAISVSIEGDGEGLRFTKMVLTRENARCTGNGSMNWKGDFAWQAELATANLDPSLFAPEWPGRLQGRVRTSGRLPEEGSVMSLEVEDLSGDLRGYPVAGQGKLYLTGREGTIKDLELRSGSTVVTASGRWNGEMDLDFRLQSEDLAEAWPGAAGGLQLDGHVQGSLEAPVVNCDLTGRNLAYQDFAISSLTGKVRGSLNGGKIAVTLGGEQVRTGDFEANQVNLSLAGSRSKHQLDIGLGHAAGEAELRLSGALNGLVWQGEITRAAVRSPQYGAWNLGEAAALKVSSQEVKTDTLCLLGKDGDTICAMGQWSIKEGWLMDGRVTNLALSTMEEISGQSLPMEGILEGSLSLQGEGAAITSGSLEVDASAAAIKTELPPPLKDRLAWKENLLTLSLADNRLTSKLDVLLPGDSFVRATAAMDQAGPLDATVFDNDLTGQVEVQLNAVEDLAPLVGKYVLPSGSLQGSMHLQGSLSAPRVAGSMALSSGKAVLPGLGVTLDPLKLSLDGDYQHLTIEADGSSGGGNLQASATCDLSKGIDQTVEVTLTGDHFEAVDLPEYRLTLSPDLRLTVSRKRGDLTGTVTIDDAWIAPENGNGSLKSSRDVTVIDDEAAKGGDAWSFYSDLTIIAGESVHVDAFGLSGRITGSLKVADQPSSLQTGNGTLQIKDGAFAIYGKQLRIGIGRLYFTGGPLDDPGVEVRAETREEGITTGVEVVGFLRNPEISFYSDPYMEQHEILSRLLTSTSIGGSSREDTGTIGAMAEKMGLGELATVMQSSKKLLNIDDIKVETKDSFSNISLIIGSWLTPRFYVSYGRNLLKESGSFNTRYTIGKGFYLKTETGSNQSGGDIKYEFER